MQAKEYGKEHERKIVLIPGNMMSWRQFENVIPILEKDFHEFTTTEKSAESIEKYIADNLDSHVDLVFVESFGAATAGMMFNRQKVKIDSIIMSGPQYMRLGVFTELIKRIIPKNQYRLTQKVKSGRKSGKMPLMLKLYTRADDENMLKMFDAMPDNITLKTTAKLYR